MKTSLMLTFILTIGLIVVAESASRLYDLFLQVEQQIVTTNASIETLARKVHGTDK